MIMGTFGLKIDSILLMDPKVGHWISVITWKEKKKGKMRVVNLFVQELDVTKKPSLDKKKSFFLTCTLSVDECSCARGVWTILTHLSFPNCNKRVE